MAIDLSLKEVYICGFDGCDCKEKRVLDMMHHLMIKHKVTAYEFKLSGKRTEDRYQKKLPSL